MVETFAKSQYLLSCSTDSSINDSLSAVMIQFDEEELRVLCVDPDPRVRAKATRQMEQKCMRSRETLTMDSYLTIRDLSSNSSVNVRLSALRILERLAQRYPDDMVKNQRGHDVRVHDDVFSIMCHAINDLETFVRAEAATLLSRFRWVSNHFLHQTLDKKLLAPMKIQKDGTTGQTSLRGGWSTGKKFGETAPDIPDDDDEGTALLPTNTCGAFVTALEDEFMSVRLPAVCSMCFLASTRPDFAAVVIDHVSDMFNDEMYEVRLASIHALTPLFAYVKLNQAQMDSILSVLADATPDTRWALHKLLAVANLADSECIRLVMKALMISMQRFPRDRDSIFKCISQIGRQHPYLIHALVPEFFLIHPIFEPQEQDLNDVFYLAHLILAMNAAAVQKPIRPLIPKYAIEHYRFVRRAMPELILAIDEFELQVCSSKDIPVNFVRTEQEHKQLLEKMEVDNIQIIKADETESDKQLQFLYQQISDAYSCLAAEERIMLLKMIVKDLSISENIVEKQLSSPVRLLRLLCELLIAYDTCIRRQYNNEEATLNVIEECLHLITHIRFVYNNVSRRVLAFLAECEFHLRVEYLFLKLDSEDNVLTDVQFLGRIRKAINGMQRRFAQLSIEWSEPTDQLLQWVDEFMDSHVERTQQLQPTTKMDSKKHAFPLSLLSSESNWAMMKLMECRLGIPADMPDIRNCQIQSVRVVELTDLQGQPINYSGTGPDSIHRFVAGLPTAIRFHAHVFNLPINKVPIFRVEIVYPDDLHVYQTPETSQLVQLSDRIHRLDMNLIVSAEHWAEPSDIQIRCGVLTNLKASGSEAKDGSVKKSPSSLCEPIKFVPLLDADKLSRPNLLQLRIHPMARC